MPKKVDIKTKKTSASVKDFLAAIEDEQKRKDCFKIDKLMQEVSGQKPKLWGTAIIGYGDIQYTRSNGDVGDWFPIGFAPRKAAISLYLSCGGVDFSKFLKDLGPHKMGKGCLYIKRLSDVNAKTLKELITYAYNEAKN